MKAPILTLLTLVIVVAGCGTGNNGAGTNNGGATNNGSTNNGSSNNGQTNNGGTTNNPTTNNGVTNNGDLPDEPYFTEFSYYEEGGGGFGSNAGIQISLIGLSISNLDGNQKSLSRADADAFVQAHLGQSTMDLMINGFDCADFAGADMGGADAGSDMGSGLPPDAKPWRFEGRIQDNGNTRYDEDITNCYFSEDRRVLDLIEALDQLAASYGITR